MWVEKRKKGYILRCKKIGNTNIFL